MPDNVTLPGTGQSIASDNSSGSAVQRIKLVTGPEYTTPQDVQSGQALPVSDDTVLLRRILNVLQSMGTIDSSQRQKVNIDAIGTANLAAVSSMPINIVSGNIGIVTTVSAQTTLAGMDREMYINQARTAYADGIRTQLTFH
jgi:hypothetical protein